MDVAEDVVLGSGAGNSEKELLAALVSVQVGIGRAVGDEEINIVGNRDWRLQIGPCWNAVEFDAVELHSFVIQIDNSAGNQIPCASGILIEDEVVVAGDENPELGGNRCVPGEEVL